MQGNLCHTQRMTRALTLNRDEACPYHRRRFSGEWPFLGQGPFFGARAGSQERDE
jgi:hypothetical protein